MNAESAPLRGGGLRPRWFFYAAAIVLVVLSVMLSKSTHVVRYGTTPIVHNPGHPALTPCPTVGFDPLCIPESPFDTGGGSYPVYGPYYRLPWILVGVASALIVAGIGLAVDRR